MNAELKINLSLDFLLHRSSFRVHPFRQSLCLCVSVANLVRRFG